MKKLFTLIFGLLMTQWALAATEVDGLYYDLNTADKTATVTYHDGYDTSLGNYYKEDNINYTETSITIPASINVENEVYSVVGISSYAFCNSRKIESITIDAPITSIGEDAFSKCFQLASINIPDGVTEIPYHCFFDCSQLASINIPDGVTKIASYAFYNCFNLKRIDISDLEAWCKIDFYLFSPNPVYYGGGLYLNGKEITDLVIPASINSIKNYAFYGWSGLTSVEIPKSVTTIGEYSFSRCINLTSVEIPKSVTTIGESAFYRCSNLTSVEIPNSVTTIGSSVFMDCSSLTSVTIPNSVTSIPWRAFQGCSSLTSVTIPNSVTSIASAFIGCEKLLELTTLNPEPPTIGSNSFPANLETVYVPYGAKAAYEVADIWKDYNIVELPMELDGTLEIEDFAIEANGTAEANLSFVGELGAIRYPGFQFFMNLPEGISVSEITLGDDLSSAGFQLSHNALTENPVKVVVVNTNSGYSEETDDLLTVTFKAAANAPDGESVINLTKAYFSTPKGEDLPLDDSQTTVTISNIPVESFQISPKEEADIYVGQTYSFTATVLPENATNKEFEWTLDEVDGEEPVVEIVTNENGEITVKGLRLGTATLTATAADYMGATAKATVNVVPTPAQSVTVSAEDMILLVGTTGQLSATVSPEDTTDKTITWSSESNDIATVSEEGLVTAVAPGTVIIKATCGEVSGTCEVTVKAMESVTVKPGNGEDDGDDDDDDNTTEGDDSKTPGENTENGMSVSGSDLTLRVGQKGSITLAIEPGVNYDPQLVWTLPDGGGTYVTMTVNEENTLTASFEGLSVGKTTYTVSTPANQTAILTGKINVIAENPVMSLTVSPEELSLPKNAPAYELKATITPDEVTNGTLSWSSSSEAVASVDASGNVTPVGEGECVITVSTTDGTGLTATCKVTVTEPVDDNFTFEFDDDVLGGADAISIYLGSTYQFKPKAHDGYVLPDVIAWSSSDATTVSVEEDGTIHGLQLGDATVTATATVFDKEVTATCEVTVIAVPAASITIDGGGVKAIKQTETLELTATVLPENTTYAAVTWESSDDAVATVSQEGVVTGVEPGQVTITAYVTSQPDVKATYDITVGKLLLGDSNDNGVVTVADVVTTANYIIGVPVVDFCFVNADVTGDKKITTADVTGTINIILGISDSERKEVRKMESAVLADRLVADNFRNGGVETRIDVKLDNSMDYTALMATVAIPRGMKVNEVLAGPRAATHSLMYNINDEGYLKIILFSFSNKSFDNDNSALFTIIAETNDVTGNIEMFDIIATDSHNTDYDLGFDGGLNESIATGIDAATDAEILILTVADGIEVLNAEGQQIGIYTLEGANIASRTAASAREKFELAKGIYIVAAGRSTAKVLVK